MTEVTATAVPRISPAWPVYLPDGPVPRRVRAFIDHMAEIVAASPLFGT